MAVYSFQNPALLQGLPTLPEQIAPQQIPPQAAYINQALTPQEHIQTPDEINQQYTGAKYQLFRDNFPTPSISPREFNMQNQIYEQKFAYDAAQKELQKATTDADKTKYRKLMEDAATSANILRENAGKLGWNVDGFGADNSLGDAVQTLNLNRNRGMNELMDMPSTAAQKFDVYRELVGQGLKPHMAREVAEMYHDQFRESNIQRLTEGIGAYGMNPDGSLNQFGQMLAGKLYNENPNAYGNIVNGFASPRDVYNTNANLANTTLQNQGAWERANLSANTSKEIAADALNEKIREYNDTRQFDLYKYNNDDAYRRDVQAKTQANIEYQRLHGTPYGQAMEWAFYGKNLMGLSDKDSITFANAMVTASKGKGSSDDAKWDQARIETQNIFANQLEKAAYYLEKDDFENATTTLNGLEDLIGNPEFKNGGLLTPDDTQALMQISGLYKKVASGEITLEEARKVLNKHQPSNYKGENDKKLADIMNENQKRREQSQQNNGNNQNEKVGRHLAKPGVYRSPDGRTYDLSEAHYIPNDWVSADEATSEENPNSSAQIQNSNPQKNYVTPKLSVGVNGMVTVDNWDELDLDTRNELLKRGINNPYNPYAGQAWYSRKGGRA